MTFTKRIAYRPKSFSRYGKHHIYCKSRDNALKWMPYIRIGFTKPKWFNRRIVSKIWQN